MGYGPGVVLYTIFGFFAGYAGFLLWRMFLGLDSDRYPLKSYGDMAFRLYGRGVQHTVSVLQSIQLLFNVGIIIVINGLSLEQIVTGSGAGEKCFIILVFVWALAGISDLGGPPGSLSLTLMHSARCAGGLCPLSTQMLTSQPR